MSPPDVKALRELAQAVRAIAIPGYPPIRANAELGALLDGVDALPADGVVVSRALLERVREALVATRSDLPWGAVDPMTAAALAEIDGALR